MGICSISFIPFVEGRHALHNARKGVNVDSLSKRINPSRRKELVSCLLLLLNG